MRDFLFLSGEFHITVPIVYRNPRWHHSTISRKIELSSNSAFNRVECNENFKGCIIHADIEDESIKSNIYDTILSSNVLCYPNIKLLKKWQDRRKILLECYNQGFINHKVLFIKQNQINDIDLKFPYVLKVGNEHRGIGKFLIKSKSDFPKWDGIATCEPFFEGISCRVLFIDNYCFGIKVENQDSWIKNSAGAETCLWYDMPKEIFAHALKVKNHFGLDICGIDYICSKSKFHFLEYNLFPGLNACDESAKIASSFFIDKMTKIEKTYDWIVGANTR